MQDNNLISMTDGAEKDGDGVANTRQPSQAEARLIQNFSVLEQYIAEAERLLAEGHPEEAALSASAGTWVAAKKHPGMFASGRLENVLRQIGAGIPDSGSSGVRKAGTGEVHRILNVATEVFPVGGLTRMLSRWIDTDADREHSLVVTRYRQPLPQHLTDAVSRSGGSIRLLNKEPGTMLSWAAKLREMSRQYDLVILHIHNEDVVPIIAFAGAKNLPPVILLNHADHLFWLGSGICHAVLNLRDAAADITTGRRGIPSERSLMLPTLVDAPVRRMSREEARAAIGITDDSVVMISVARGAKYRPIGGKTYADRFVGLLKANPKARMFVVGSGMPEEWEAARAETGGRIIGLPERPDPWQYFEAADIYVDSYPFSSSTSLMEAAGYGLPLVTLFTAPDEARLVGINHLGLIGGVYQARTESEWEAEITRLVQDAGYRAQRAQQADESVRIAQPIEWKVWMERAYKAAMQLPPLPPHGLELTEGPDRLHLGEPDIRHEDMYGSEADADDYIRLCTGMLSLPARVRTIARLQKMGAIRSPVEAVRLLVPEWVKRRLRG